MQVLLVGECGEHVRVQAGNLRSKYLVPWLAGCAVAILTLPASGLAAAHSVDGGPSSDPTSLVLYLADPLLITVAEFGSETDYALVTDVEAVDFDTDGRLDIAVAWQADRVFHFPDFTRMLTVFRNTGTGFTRLVDIDLFVPDFDSEARSVFYYGTSEIGIGDFDGDGDTDLAVGAHYGDELWFIENLGGGAYNTILRFPFDTNSSGRNTTPAAMCAADFNGDGRDELAVLADPTLHIGGHIVHFWTTDDTMNNLHRIIWHGIDGMIETHWTRAMAVADFNDDGQPDLCYSGTTNPASEIDPILTFWYDLEVETGEFTVHNEFPSQRIADIVPVPYDPAESPGLFLLHQDSASASYWQQLPGGMDWAIVEEISGYTGCAEGWGMSALVNDVEGDGDLDLVTKQKLGGPDEDEMIQFTLRRLDESWTLDSWTPVDTTGLVNPFGESHRRPHNLAAGDFFGNARDEIVAAFGWRPISNLTGGANILEIAVWSNSCRGDVFVDGKCNAKDIGAVCASLGTCTDDPLFNPHADVNKSGTVDSTDLALVLQNFGCRCEACEGLHPGDANCDGLAGFADVDGFAIAMRGREAYEARFPNCQWLNSDCTGDRRVTFVDVEPFTAVISCGGIQSD